MVAAHNAKLTEEQRQEIAEIYKHTRRTIRDIAQQFGVNHKRVTEVARAHGLHRAYGHPLEMDAAKKRELLSMYNRNDVTIYEIARVFGITPARVCQIANTNGYFRSPKRTSYSIRLRDEAGKRGISVKSLKSLILQKVAEDNLFLAVLDDA